MEEGNMNNENKNSIIILIYERRMKIMWHGNKRIMNMNNEESIWKQWRKKYGNNEDGRAKNEWHKNAMWMKFRQK